MGISTDAVLAYGYDLGGLDTWQLEDTDSPDVEWYNEDEHGPYGFDEALDLQIQALQLDGIGFATYCSHEYPQYILSTKTFIVWRGHVKGLDAALMASDPLTGKWDQKLSAALIALGLKPKQKKAQWLLCSYLG